MAKGYVKQGQVQLASRSRKREPPALVIIRAVVASDRHEPSALTPKFDRLDAAQPRAILPCNRLDFQAERPLVSPSAAGGSRATEHTHV